MRSPILLGLIGFAIVMGALLGGFALGGLLHSWLTPDHNIFFMVWMWLGLIPFFWLLLKYTDTAPFRHPIRAYVLLLPCLMLIGTINDLFEPDNPWRWFALAASILVAATFMRVLSACDGTDASRMPRDPESPTD